MSKEIKKGKQDKGSDAAEKVVVAVKASKEIPKTALVWALTHVVQPGDCITLLVVVPSQSSGMQAIIYLLSFVRKFSYLLYASGPRFEFILSSGNLVSRRTEKTNTHTYTLVECFYTSEHYVLNKCNMKITMLFLL